MAISTFFKVSLLMIEIISPRCCLGCFNDSLRRNCRTGRTAILIIKVRGWVNEYLKATNFVFNRFYVDINQIVNNLDVPKVIKIRGRILKALDECQKQRIFTVG